MGLFNHFRIARKGDALDGPPGPAGREALSPTTAEIVQAKIIAVLSCPETRGAVEVAPTELAGRAIRRGVIWSRALKKAVGKIEDFQLDFVRAAPMSASDFAGIKRRRRAGTLPKYTESVPAWRLAPRTSEGIEYIGWLLHIDRDDVAVIEHADAAIKFESSGETEILFQAHPWSGIVEVRYRDKVDVLDLYGAQSAFPRAHRIDLGPGRQRVEIRLTGAKNEAALGVQCVFSGFRTQTEQRVPLRHDRQATVRGAAFTDDFRALLEATPQDGILLDIGGGNRQFDDARYVNLDYADYHEPDVIGDATKLPFRDGSIDAVYSTGVFEHIGDPAKAGGEVARVLKPGGRAVIGWAFMQPIHSEGHHFYNATPWGVERAFAGLKVKRLWYETSFSALVEWGASVSGLRGRVPDEEISSVCDTLRRWDALIPEYLKSYMANGVWCEFEKA